MISAAREGALPFTFPLPGPCGCDVPGRAPFGLALPRGAPDALCKSSRPSQVALEYSCARLMHRTSLHKPCRLRHNKCRTLNPTLRCWFRGAHLSIPSSINPAYRVTMMLMDHRPRDQGLGRSVSRPPYQHTSPLGVGHVHDDATDQAVKKPACAVLQQRLLMYRLTTH